ncbi:NAD(P)/FAD-dependent oxidoreductase [Streptomyces sp. NPDC001939]
MENYRLTPRNTIVFGVRRLERGTTYPLSQKRPDPALVEELAEAFAARFPALSDVAIERAWGGWIAITSSWLPLAGQIEEDVFYSIACNGHGLAQAPYVGTLIADPIVDGERHEDLEGLWMKEPKFPRPMMMGPLGAHHLGRRPFQRSGQRKPAQCPARRGACGLTVGRTAG